MYDKLVFLPPFLLKLEEIRKEQEVKPVFDPFYCSPKNINLK